MGFNTMPSIEDPRNIWVTEDVSVSDELPDGIDEESFVISMIDLHRARCELYKLFMEELNKHESKKETRWKYNSQISKHPDYGRYEKLTQLFYTSYASGLREKYRREASEILKKISADCKERVEFNRYVRAMSRKEVLVLLKRMSMIEYDSHLTGE